MIVLKPQMFLQNNQSETTLKEKAKISLSSTRRSFLTQTVFPSFFFEVE